MRLHLKIQMMNLSTLLLGNNFMPSLLLCDKIYALLYKRHIYKVRNKRSRLTCPLIILFNPTDS